MNGHAGPGRYLLVLTAALLWACARGAEPAGTAEADAPPAPGPKVELRLRLERGRTYEVWRRSVQTERRKIGPAGQETEEQTAVVLFLACRYAVEEVDAGGGPRGRGATATATLTVPRVRVQVYSAAGAAEYDSAEEKEPAAAAAPFAVLARARLKVTLSAAGEVTILDGAEALLEEALKAVPEGEEHEAARAATRARFGAEALAQTFSPLGTALPGEAVPVGGTWSRATAVPGLGQPLRLAGTYRLDAYRNGRATIGVQQRFERDPEAPPARPGAIRGSVRGTGTGRLLVDARTGWIRQGQVEQEVHLSGTIQAGRRSLPATATLSIRTRLGPTAESVAPEPAAEE